MRINECLRVAVRTLVSTFAFALLYGVLHLSSPTPEQYLHEKISAYFGWGFGFGGYTGGLPQELLCSFFSTLVYMPAAVIGLVSYLLTNIKPRRYRWCLRQVVIGTLLFGVLFLAFDSLPGQMHYRIYKITGAYLEISFSQYGRFLSWTWRSLLYVPFFLIALIWFGYRIRSQIHAEILCNKCGYDLTGNISGTCPECGQSIPEDSKSNSAKQMDIADRVMREDRDVLHKLSE